MSRLPSFLSHLQHQLSFLRVVFRSFTPVPFFFLPLSTSRLRFFPSFLYQSFPFCHQLFLSLLSVITTVLLVNYHSFIFFPLSFLAFLSSAIVFFLSSVIYVLPVICHFFPSWPLSCFSFLSSVSLFSCPLSFFLLYIFWQARVYFFFFFFERCLYSSAAVASRRATKLATHLPT
jgi:hypothetical protein